MERGSKIMNGLMAKLENMFVKAIFAEGPSVNIFGRFNCLSNHKGRKSTDDINLYEEIFTVARDLYERSGRIEGRDLDNWLEAEKIVKTLRSIAGDDGKRCISVNVPEARYAENRKMRMKSLSFVRRYPVERL
jgi:hypothetical protein